MSSSGKYVFQGKQKNTMNLAFITHEQVAEDMNKLVEHYETTFSNSDLNKTRNILGRISTLNKELSDMREENR